MSRVSRNTWFIALICLLFVACGGDVAPSDISASDGSTEDTGTPDSGTDQGTGVDQGSSDTGTPDVGTSDEGSSVDTPPPPIDNLLGSSCEEDTDCVQDPEHVCFFGFCTTRCRDSGELIPGACGNVSAQSIYGDQWACPSDIVYCMPGSVQDKTLICTNDAQCESFGNDVYCAGAILSDASHVDGMCLPALGDTPHGGSCFEGNECHSQLCLGADSETSQPGTCLTHCEANTDCGEAPHVCQGIGFITDSEVDPPVVGAWAGLCVPVGEGSSLEYCGFVDCPEGDSCSASTRPDNFLAQYWCEEGNAGAAEAGTECTQGSDCFNGSCFYGDTEIEGATGYCTRLCPSSASPCPEAMHCTQLTLNEKGTPDVTWDDPTFGICTFGEAGRPCELDTAGWCDEGLSCLTQEGDTFPEGTGLCGEAACEPSCGDAVCGDDGCGASCGDCGGGFGCNGEGQCDPVCVEACGANSTCTAPDICTCTEGWSGEDCDTATCVEACGVNSTCTAPDTCTCTEGWSGEDCAVPACEGGCGDNGSCTAPGVCTCNEGFSGDDCSESCADTSSCFGDACTVGEDCESGHCVPVDLDNSVCTVTCAETAECPDGYFCDSGLCFPL